MAEKIISPGVFTKENDLSFVQQGVGAIGAAIVGPTVKGPAMVPTKVYSYTEYQALFGDSFKSGSDYFQYFTSITAKEYLKHGGPLTVCRVLAGTSYLPATASAHMAKASTPLVTPAIFTWSLADGGMTETSVLDDGALIQYTASDGDTFLFQGETGVIPANNPSYATNALGTTTGIYYFAIGAKLDTNGAQTLDTTTSNFFAGNTGSGAGQDFATLTGDTLTSWSFDNTQPVVTWQITGSNGNNTSGDITVISGSATSASVAGTYPANTSVAYVSQIGGITVMNELVPIKALSGVPKALNNLGTATTWDTFTASFQIKTIADGAVMNSTPQTAAGVVGVGKNDLLTTGSVKY